MVFSSRPPKNKKRNKTIYTGKLQQAKEEREIFLGFLLVTTTTGMESKLAKSYNYFFWFYLKVFQTHKKKA